MLSNKPYLVRAFYEWIVDSKCTPFLVINANYPKCKIPEEFVEDGQITLNIFPEAIRDLKIGNEFLEFRASFSGVIHIISAPIKAILAIYAQENGQGMFFDFEDDDEGVDTIVNHPTIETEVHQQGSINSEKSEKKRPSYLKLVD